jgi:hypothetical protein
MKDWIEAYWAYRIDLAKEKRYIKLEIDWFWPVFWIVLAVLYLKGLK